jgi:hypothetical protein
MELMSEQLPLLKANWISGGETAALLTSLEGCLHRHTRFPAQILTVFDEP